MGNGLSLQRRTARSTRCSNSPRNARPPIEPSSLLCRLRVYRVNGSKGSKGSKGSEGSEGSEGFRFKGSRIADAFVPMPMTPGSRLGPYEIVAPLGRGGMGEVYRARDTKLNRDVAIKVLLAAVANDADRLARFSREAQLLASLNHPNIAHIHGFEDSNGAHALVMELVEGPTLADRIALGAISLEEALPIAKQIAEAVEAAHQQGIIHRDLKPANIKVRGDGTVKVLDFGLAKALDPIGGSSSEIAASPTVSPQMTVSGMILGTSAYMSPEQARGRAVDARADIWAFGCVLFDMLTAKRAFDGDDVTDTIVAV